LLIYSLVNGFSDGVRAVLVRGCQGIAHSSARQQLFRRFARRIAQRMGAHYSFFLSSTAFTTDCAPYCSPGGSGLLIPLLVNSVPDGLRAVLLSGWQRIAHSSARQRLLRRFTHRIAQGMAADFSFFRLSMAFKTLRAPYGSADGIGLLILPLVNSIRGLRAVLPCEW